MKGSIVRPVLGNVEKYTHERYLTTNYAIKGPRLHMYIPKAS